MKQNNKLLSFAALVSAAGLMTGMTATASAAGSLQGAGSTLIAPLMAKWTADFGNLDGISVTYSPVGSGAGIAQISARTVDFGASDAPLSPQQAAGCNGCVQIPWALTATGIAFHLNGVAHLRMSGPVLAGIYLGQIKSWNDAKIKKLNPHAALPALAITPAYRSDGSGDTYAFTDYLSRVSRTWKSQIGFATAVSFPTGVGGKGNDGITALVSSTNGAIGYISASYIIAHRLGAAALQNAAGKFELPNLVNIASAGSQIKRVPSNNELHIVNPPAKYKVAYPLSTFSYVIVPKSTPQAAGLKAFISYALGRGQSLGLPLDFSPVPAVVKSAGLATANSLGG